MADNTQQTRRNLTPEQKRKLAANRQNQTRQQNKSAKTGGSQKASGNDKQGMTSPKHGAEALAALVVREKKTARLLMGMMLFLVVITSISISWNITQTVNRPEPKLLATTEDGRFLPLPLMDEPVESTSQITNWARRYIPQMYTWNYSNYQSEINSLLEFSTENTLQRFQQVLNESGILDEVRSNFLILEGRLSGNPIVLDEQIVSGNRVWIVEVPLDLIYDSGEVEDNRRRQVTQEIAFRAWIARGNPLEYPDGLRLVRFEVMPR